MNPVLMLLVYVGLTRRKRDGSWFVPIHVPPKWVFRSWRDFKGHCLFWGWAPYAFTNRRCNAWSHKHPRLLPFRWGIGWLGFEFGDRGGEHVRIARHGEGVSDGA